jgi:methylmalonyl-CoA mutase
MPTTGSAPPFPPVSYAAWRQGVEAESGPDAVASRLRAMTEDGIPIEPLYAPGGPGDGEARNLAGRVVGLLPAPAGAWCIRQQFPAATSPEVLATALAGGVQSLEFLSGRGEGPGQQFARTLSELDLRDVELSFEDLQHPLPAGLDFPRNPLSLGVDPIGRALRHRGTAGQMQSALAQLGAARPVAGRSMRLLRASGESFFDAGGTPVMTLGAALAVALTYLRALADGGADPAWAASAIEVRLPCGPRFFESAAMLRAARLVWARVLELAGVAPTPLRLVASTGRRSLTRHDPWNNALRNTTVAFAGAIGGADILQLLPHDARTAEPGAAALRLARTTGLVLRDEASLRRVLDPAEGSWFLETFTAELAEGAWEELRRLDAEGGIVAAIESGQLSRRISEAAAARHERVRSRRHPIIGVSEHPVAGEVAPPAPGEIAEHAGSTRPFPFRPDALPFEQLRDAAAMEHALRAGGVS